jgi:hypothetical protein
MHPKTSGVAASPYKTIDTPISLNFLNFLKRLLVVLIGENISIWKTSFRFESSCARNDGM